MVVSASASYTGETISYSTDATGWLWFVPYNDTQTVWTLKPSYICSIPRANNYTPVASVSTSDVSIDYTEVGCRFNELLITAEDGFQGKVALFLSWYYASDIDCVWSLGMTEDQYLYFPFEITDSNGNVLTYQSQCSFFQPEPTGYASVSDGFMVALEIDVPSDTTVISIKAGGLYNFAIAETSEVGNFDLIIPSASLMVGRTPTEVEVLESIYNQFQDWNDVNDIPAGVVDKVGEAEQVIADINSLVKPDPGQIVPDYLPDPEALQPITDAFSPFFQNALIVQLCTMVLGFAFVSYVLFGKKG